MTLTFLAPIARRTLIPNPIVRAGTTMTDDDLLAHPNQGPDMARRTQDEDVDFEWPIGHSRGPTYRLGHSGTNAVSGDALGRGGEVESMAANSEPSSYDLASSFIAGRLSRRDFLVRLVALGGAH